jgi:hypothetical protein
MADVASMDWQRHLLGYHGQLFLWKQISILELNGFNNYVLE